MKPIDKKLDLTNMSDSQIRVEAMKMGSDIVDGMRAAKTNPTVSIDGESLRVWKEFEEWGFLEKYPIEDENNKWLYQTIIAMTQYRHFRWKKENPVKQKRKLTKWEYVMGRASK